MLKGLLLDFYGTVVEDNDDVMDAVAERVAAGASKQVAGRDVARAWALEFEAVAGRPPFRSMRECAMRSLATVMAEVDCPGDPASLYAAQSALWGFPTLRPGTREFLSRVPVPICVLSDADRAELEATMAFHGLAFAAVVTSEDVTAYKPARAMFTRALTALGLAAHEVLHVGDSLSADVAGAHAAGIRAVWINRRGQAPPEDLPIAYEVANLGDLLVLIN